MQRLIILNIISSIFLLSMNAYAGSVVEYTRAIEQSPPDMKYKFYFLRGMAYREMRDVDAAIKDFSTSIQIHPTHYAYLRRGEMYFEKGVYSVAVSNFSQAIALNPSMEAYRLRGYTYLVLNNLDMAIADGTQLIKLAPNTSDSYNIRMEAYAQNGKVELARQDARRALSLDRGNSIAMDLLVKYPEKIELTTGTVRFRPKGDISKYRVWASTQGYAFTPKTEGDESSIPGESP